jgi:RimJ/RimL family protein N-acetyltransferase
MIPFDLSAEYILEDDIALLRPLKRTDLEYLLPFSINEPDTWKYSLVQAGGGEEKMKHYIELALTGRENKKEYPFIVFDKRQNHYAGSTRFYDIQFNNKTLQLGYTWYGKKFQGTGLNKHCKYLLLEFAFDKIGMERVEFRADNTNARSIAAMKSIGCTAEGILRSDGLKPDGTRRDSIVLSILRDEWKNKIKKELGEKLLQKIS